MTDPNDPMAEWLAPRDTDYLPPPPGSFNRLYRRARRRYWAKAGAGTAAFGVLVVGGFLGVQRVVGLPAPQPGWQPAASAPAASTTPERTTPGPTTAGPTAAGPTAGNPPPSSSPASTGPAPCTTDQVTVSAQVDPNGAGASNRTMFVIVTNRSAVTCTVKGYPQVRYADGGHRAVGRALPLGGQKATTVTLPPHQSAHLSFQEIVDPPAVVPNCAKRTVAGYLMTLPGETTSLFAPQTATICTNADPPPLDQPFTAGTGL